MPKYVLDNIDPEFPVRLCLEMAGNDVLLIAEKGTLRQYLMRISREGTVVRCGSVADDFGLILDEQGKVIVE